MDMLRGAARSAAEITLGAEHGALFYAYDTLAYPDTVVDLAARLQKAENLQPVTGATIGFFRGEEPIAQAQTDADGRARAQVTLTASGDHAFTARVLALPPDANPDILNVSPAPLLAAVRPKDAKFIVVDLDYTVVGTGFHTVLLGQAEPMAGSQEALTELAKGYSILYLTHRPDLLANRSRRWLDQYKYPAGPLLVSDLQAALGASETFKTAKLAEIRQRYPNAAIGIGDKLSDAQSYADNGLRAYLLPHYKHKPRDMRQMARELRRLHSEVRVAWTWPQIQRDILEGNASINRFPPSAYADWLDRQAAEWETAEDRED